MHQRNSCSLVNSLPLSASMPADRRHDLLEGLQGPLLGLITHRPVDRLPSGDVGDGQREAELPGAVPPSWPNRSISTNPGTTSPEFAQVRTGTCDFNRLPVSVCERPGDIIFARSPAKRRAIVAALILHSNAASASVRPSLASRRSRGTNTDSIGANRWRGAPPST